MFDPDEFEDKPIDDFEDFEEDELEEEETLEELDVDENGHVRPRRRRHDEVEADEGYEGSDYNRIRDYD